MKKSRNKIIIKTKKGGYTKLYADGKWQKRVKNIDFHADCYGGGINIKCEFDAVVCGKYNVPQIKDGEIVTKHHTVII